MESIKLSRESSIAFIKLLESPPEITQGLIELLRCDVTNYKNQFLCSFTPDQRMMRLEDMVVDYYKGITDDMSDRECRLNHKEFVKWCMEWGYTKAQIDKAMQDALGRNDI